MIDKEVLAGYNAGREKGRLHRDLGLIEFERTKELLLEELPPAPAVVYDVGGAYGEYAYFLAEKGYEVHLFDLAQEHIRMAREWGRQRGVCLAAAEVADALCINRPDASADAVLLFGPLYHLTDAAERILCLQECFRLLRPGGRLFTAGITCYATILKYVVRYSHEPLLDDDAFFSEIAHTVRTGLHTRKPMGTSHFHRPDELRAEVAASGFIDTELRGVLGPCWMIPDLDAIWQDERKKKSVMRIVRLLEKEESLMGLSTHFVGISRKPMA